MARPRKYKTAEELQQKIDEYFEKSKPEPVTIQTDEGEIVAKDKNGNAIFTTNHPTIPGLAYHLGFATKESLYYYRDELGDEDISKSIKRAFLYIESYHVNRMSNGDGGAGLIFMMKNMGYTDRQVLQHEGTAPIDIKVRFENAEDS